jgi:predicted DNA binding protein
VTYVAEFTIPPEGFPFGETLRRMPDVRIRIDQLVPTGESALPFLWVHGCDPAAFVASAEDEPAVRETRLLEEADHVALFRSDWTPNADVIETLKRLEVTINEAVGTADHWRFEVRAGDPSAFGEFRDAFESNGIPCRLTRLYGLEELLSGDHRTVSTKQRETLLAAYREGYFDKPRAVTQDELASRFDVSRRAVSERLRRGSRNLISDALLPDAGGGDRESPGAGS